MICAILVSLTILRNIWILRFLKKVYFIQTQCLKNTEKVSFNIASEVHKKCLRSILASFWNNEACCQTVLPDMSIQIEQKLVEMPKLKKSNETFWVFSNYLYLYYLILILFERKLQVFKNSPNWTILGIFD